MLEKQITAKIIKHLNSLDGCVAFKVHGGHFATPGISDVICCLNGKFIALEVKQPSRLKNVSKAQQLFLDNVSKSGGLSRVVSSLTDVVDLVNDLA